MVLNYVRYREFTYSGSKEAIKKRKQRDKAGHKGDMSPNGGDISASASASASEDLDTRLTQLLVDLMIKNNPKSSIIKRLTPKRHEEWVNQCRLLRTIDQKTPGEIKRVILFSQSDSFWKSNILSMPKLREKWDQLWLKAKVSQPSEGASHPKLSEMSEKDRADLREFEKIKEKMIGEVAKKYDGQIQALRDSGKNDEAFQKLNERQEEFEIEIAKEWRRIKGIKVKGEEARS